MSKAGTVRCGCIGVHGAALLFKAQVQILHAVSARSHSEMLPLSGDDQQCKKGLPFTCLWPLQDVTVCEAYLAFLHSGNMDDYWRTLWDNGGITREAITSKWDRKIPGERGGLLQTLRLETR